MEARLVGLEAEKNRGGGRSEKRLTKGKGRMVGRLVDGRPVEGFKTVE